MNKSPERLRDLPDPGAYALELPIEFAGGSGVTRLISRREVCFATVVPLVAGQRLAGTLRFPARDGDGATLRFIACVVCVTPPSADERVVRDVTARFERLEFAPPEGAPELPTDRA
jgi:hypothetical protein